MCSKGNVARAVGLAAHIDKLNGMNFIQKYISYVKDNPEGYWFKRKLFGWGWTPVKWQGWAVIAVYVTLLIALFRHVDTGSHSASDTLIGFAVPFVVLTGALIVVAYLKGEPPHWMWGFPKEDDD